MGFLLASCLSALSLSVVSTVAQEVFISEIHYDNFGGDSGEAVEVTGPAGTSLDGWSIPLYNGNGGGVYATISLSGIIPDQGSGFGALGFTESGIQNGIDGLALVDARNSVLQFLSYEGLMVRSKMLGDLVGGHSGRRNGMEEFGGVKEGAVGVDEAGQGWNPHVYLTMRLWMSFLGVKMAALWKRSGWRGRVYDGGAFRRGWCTMGES